MTGMRSLFMISLLSFSRSVACRMERSTSVASHSGRAKSRLHAKTSAARNFPVRCVTFPRGNSNPPVRRRFEERNIRLIQAIISGERSSPMQPDRDVKSLMIRYQQGDRTAAGALVERLSPPLHRFFLMQPVSRRYADDLLQETWMRVHQARHTYRPGEPVLPWMMQSHDGLTSTAIVERGESARTRVRWTRPGPPTRREIYTGALPP